MTLTREPSVTPDSTTTQLDLKRLKKALRAVYGAQDMETADRTGLTFTEVVAVRAEEVAKIYEGRVRSGR